MRPYRLLALCLASVALAYQARATEPDSAAATPAVAPAADTPKREKMLEVTLDPNAKEPVCRRYVPTGSRIAGRRCEMPQDEPTATQQANRDVLRRDVEALRNQQMAMEQARQAAMAEAMRRRGAGR